LTEARRTPAGDRIAPSPRRFATRWWRDIAPVAAALLAGSCLATEPASCASEADDARRLACYDRLFTASPAGRAAGATANPVAPAVPVTHDAEHPTSVMSKAWELGPDDKRGTFVVRTYLPNFLLPVHYTTHVNQSPSSPTQLPGASHPSYKKIEAKLQISLRAKVAEDLLLPGADLWFAFTQRSLWQVWDQQDSSPFRSTDYQPEAIYVIPVPAKLGDLPFGWNLRMIQLGLAHQSNGQSDPLSRSWNRTYISAGFERGDVGLTVRANHRLPEPSDDQNPDLTKYIGHGEVMMNWFPGPSTLSLTWRPNLQRIERGSVQFDLTHPVFADKPSGLRWYVQFFNGYGETLLDYNHRQTRLGVGLSLFQF